MARKRIRQFSAAFKEATVRRVLAGEGARAVAAELRLSRSVLYTWRRYYERGGINALVSRGRPSKAAAGARQEALGQEARRPAWLFTPGGEGPDPRDERIRELERKVAQQALELDFFNVALRTVKGPRLPSSARGATGSSRSSTR
jgi:transposase-like protein